MQKKYLTFVAFFATVGFSLAQVSGNLLYNENNRFEQSQSYKGKSKGRKDQSAPYMGNVQSNASTDDALMSQVTNTYSTYSSGNEHIVRVNVLYNANPQNYTAIFHINQAGKKVAELDSLLQNRVNKFI